MKKLIIFTAGLLATLFALSACGGSDDFKDDAELETIIGVLTEQLPNDDRKGTHILTVKDDEEIAVRSLSLNLSQSRYLDSKVETLGFLNLEDEVFEITGISVVEEAEEEEEEEEAELIEYRSSDLGFELKFYSDWEVDESSDSVVFTAPDPDETGEDTDAVEIKQFPFDYSPKMSEDGELDTPLSAFLTSFYPGATNYTDSKLGVDELKAVELENNGVMNYFMYRNGLIYNFSFTPSAENFAPTNEIIFNEMIRLFRFIGFTADGIEGEIPDEEELIPGEDGESEEAEAISFGEIPDPGITFTTFESLPFHFSAQFPASWYYAGESSPDSSVRHHYGFSEDTVEGGNEVISMDIYTGSVPAGQTVNLGDLSIVKVAQGGEVSLYLTVDGQGYRVFGDNDYEEIMMVMASSIAPIAEEEGGE